MLARRSAPRPKISASGASDRIVCLDAVAHRGDLVRVRERFARDLRRRAEAGDAGEIFRAGAMALLLAAAGDERLRHHQVGRGDERADALRTADLVRGEDQVIGRAVRDVERDAACRLHGVEHEHAAGILHDLADLARGLDDAGLVVGEMDRDERQAFRAIMRGERRAQVQRDRTRRCGRRRCGRRARRESARRSAGRDDRLPTRRASTCRISPRPMRQSGVSSVDAASVAPEVKTTWSGLALTSAATSRRASSMMRRALRPSPCTEDGLADASSAASIAVARLGQQRRARIVVEIGAIAGHFRSIRPAQRAIC